MAYKVRYKLTMVEELDDIRSEVCIMGYFDSEEKLKQWAEKNNGGLVKENKED